MAGGSEVLDHDEHNQVVGIENAPSFTADYQAEPSGTAIPDGASSCHDGINDATLHLTEATDTMHNPK
jgi:hypothetical protein